MAALLAATSLLPAQDDNRQTESLYETMLSTVSSSQREDGSWWLNETAGAKRPLLGTGLCLLALMTSGSSLDRGKHKPAILAATSWLRTHQTKDGWLADDPADLESHAITTCALFYVFGMSGEPRALREPCERAISVLIAHASADKASPSPAARGFAALVLPRASNFKLATDVALIQRWGSVAAPAASRSSDALALMAELWCRVAPASEGKAGERAEQLLTDARRLSLVEAGSQRPCDLRAFVFAGLASAQLRNRGEQLEAHAAWCKKIDDSLDPQPKGLDRFKLLMQPSTPWAEGIGETGRLALATFAVGLRVFHAQIVD